MTKLIVDLWRRHYLLVILVIFLLVATSPAAITSLVLSFLLNLPNTTVNSQQLLYLLLIGSIVAFGIALFKYTQYIRLYIILLLKYQNWRDLFTFQSWLRKDCKQALLRGENLNY
ncbi:MAG: hypothetical protein M0Z27_02920, partial [Thermaerobacter sp.]|nr:hypothetical protein [Thermaerobacter sp.]